jgi:hypothetical protein
MVYPAPTIRVERLSDLTTALPASTRQVNPEERRRAIDERLAQVTRLVGG